MITVCRRHTREASGCVSSLNCPPFRRFRFSDQNFLLIVFPYDITFYKYCFYSAFTLFFPCGFSLYRLRFIHDSQPVHAYCSRSKPVLRHTSAIGMSLSYLSRSKCAFLKKLVLLHRYKRPKHPSMHRIG